ncbi:helix-turn-helix domain-containing protein [Xenorhabdus bovienii]|uniref:helix-turn-helix domain-containing protein n=1 Tax=Xenorhabdus bovienii TaxID=40576 RepID=UPI0012D2EC10|nr:helix-turn-helix domain-containing protein [Xenorhabdus bovienii]MDE9452949.1 helix-turn-helix domain-containing protein [Xenorhabdus bovienii]
MKDVCGHFNFAERRASLLSLDRLWVIARRLGLHPSKIWLSRYFDNAGNLIERTPRIPQQSSHSYAIFDGVTRTSFA